MIRCLELTFYQIPILAIVLAFMLKNVITESWALLTVYDRADGRLQNTVAGMD